MNLLDVALSCAARGWHVFPCWPKTKKPMTAHGWKDATTDAAAIRAWWEKTPDANIAIACGASGLCVLDIDHGIANGEAFNDYVNALPDMGFPPTFVVRTGRRPEFGAQMYFQGAIPDVGLWKLNGCEGQIKSLGGYVMAAGSVHPSGERYEVFADEDVQATPEWVRALRPERLTKPDDGAPITVNRNVTLTSIAGKLRNAGLGREALEVALLQVNADRCAPPLDEDEVRSIASHAAAWKLPEVAPEVVLGGSKVAASEPLQVRDWRELFHTREEMENAPPISFLIDGFLQCEGVTAIAAPVRERKSLIAINIVHSLLTGEKLFGHFDVVKRPTRVLYLVPEVSLGPWTDRLRKIGLMEFIGTTLFCRTLSSSGHLSLDDPALLDALPGCVVFLDTAIRFLSGDENSSTDVRAFADSIFALLRNGAESVVMLHHSPKDSGDQMTLENAMRGSGDMGAFLASCWGTKLQDPTKPYESTSFITNLKQRDFESKDIEVSCDEQCKMRLVGEPGEARLQIRKGFKGDKDGKDEAAETIIRAHPGLSVRKLTAKLAEAGIKRGTTWVLQTRARVEVAEAADPG